MWPVILPVAIVPLWQEKHVPVTWVWSSGSFAGFQTDVWWQASHLSVDAMCPVFLPLAVVPLWQLMQLVVIPV